jgi:uncharacterized phiE125 gp8 family phage protein
MPLELLTPPASEPVSLAEAKLHLRLDTDADDDLVTRLIAAARTRLEWHTGRAFLTQSWRQWLDAWPQTNCVEIALPPLRNLTQLTFHRADDTASDLDASLYQLDSASEPARLMLKPTTNAPTNLRRLNAVSLTFTSGYGDDAVDVPAPLREALLELVAHLYQHRGDAPAELPLTVLALAEPYRIFRL